MISCISLNTEPTEVFLLRRVGSVKRPKTDTREPLLFGAVVVVLLLLRIPPIRRSVSHARGWLKHNVFQKTLGAFSKASLAGTLDEVGAKE